jgi:adenylate cyclase
MQVRFERTLRCEAPPARLWPLLADTERLNRFIGMAPLDTHPVDDPESLARMELSTHVGPIAVRYREEPFRWQEQRYFSFRREMLGGPNRSLFLRYDLSPRERRGTDVRLEMVAVPRLPVSYPVVWWFTRKAFHDILSFIEAVDAHVAGGQPLAFDRTAPDDPTCRRLAGELASRHEPGLVRHLMELVENAPDVDARRMRPFEAALAWGADRDDVLRLFLDATTAGLLSLTWAVMCPSCRVGATELPSLAELDAESHCNFCDLRFGVELDRVVEALFYPHPAVRRIDRRPFCVGGPRLMAHVFAQETLAPEGVAELGAPTQEGRYRLFVRGGATATVDVAKSGAEVATVQVEDGTLSAEHLDVAPGGTVRVAGDKRARHVKLERLDSTFLAATAHAVSALPEFRSQFGKDALRPGLGLSVGRAAVLFSDLCGSTALYSRAGDAAAFRVVTECLDYGRSVVERHRGTVIKTMGDAVMAVFVEPSTALAAAAEMVTGWKAFADAHSLPREIELRVGVYDGPCTIVSANGVLDYFGQTVNAASRVEHLAGPRQVIAPISLVDVARFPAGLVEVERFEATVKGIERPLSLVRLAVAPPSPGPSTAAPPT